MGNKLGYRLRNDERGVVSIIVSIIIMLIISIVAISFARLMQREQQEALDRQLSTQAYYAAEAAVNDARKAYFDGNLAEGSEQCKTSTDAPLSKPNLDSDDPDSVVSYSCVTVESRPNDLVFDSIDTNRSLLAELRAVESGDPDAPSGRITTLTINWQDRDGNTTFPATVNNSGIPFLPPKDSWAYPGMLMVQLSTIPPSGEFTREDLLNNSKTFYLYPAQQFDGNIDYDNANTDGAVFSGNCQASPVDGRARNCKVDIVDIPPSRDNLYYMRLKSVYKPVSVQATARINGSGNNANFEGVQIVVDATGRANDVLRRIEERFPVNYSYDYAENAIETGTDLCKRLTIYSSGPRVDDATIPSCAL